MTKDKYSCLELPINQIISKTMCVKVAMFLLEHHNNIGARLIVRLKNNTIILEQIPRAIKPNSKEAIRTELLPS